METLYTAYKTNDGKLFEDRKEAEQHELGCARELLTRIFADGPMTADPAEVIDALELVLRDYRGY